MITVVVPSSRRVVLDGDILGAIAVSGIDEATDGAAAWAAAEALPGMLSED
jgi:hypothetical protein